MKKAIFFFICLLAMTSCHKKGVNLFVGDYSFKTSGEVSITAQAIIDDSNVIIPAVLNASLGDDIGQLNISVSDKDADEVIVVINYMNGDVITTTGTCDENIIELDDYQRNTLPLSLNVLLSGINTYITVSARGQMYDDDMIVFDVTLDGRTTIGSVTYKIKDKNVKMVAYRN